MCWSRCFKSDTPPHKKGSSMVPTHPAQSDWKPKGHGAVFAPPNNFWPAAHAVPTHDTALHGPSCDIRVPDNLETLPESSKACLCQVLLQVLTPESCIRSHRLIVDLLFLIALLHWLVMLNLQRTEKAVDVHTSDHSMHVFCCSHVLTCWHVQMELCPKSRIQNFNVCSAL